MSPLYKTSKNSLDQSDAPELTLTIPSFAGGENTVGQDHDLKASEARLIENWESTSIGGMKRSPGFTLVASVSGSNQIDLSAHHFEGSSIEFYAIAAGNLYIKNGSSLDVADSAAFTSGVLSHAVSAASALWITNTSDNLKRKTIGNSIGTPSSLPTTASARIYEHNFRLIAEGSGKTIYGSRAGTGNWTGSDAWSAANDAWSMIMPDNTTGVIPGFPSGTDLTVFTKFDTFVVYNQPNVARRRVTNGIGNWAPYSLAKGNEGIYLFSTYPTLGVFLWDSVNYVDLTINHDFVDDVSLSNRIFGIYRDNRYYLIYNEQGSGVSYPNRMKIYDAAFGRWYTRTINTDVSDTLGYPALLTRSANEIYIGSSQVRKIYDFEDSSTSDNGQDTDANYLTKIFTSKDFGLDIDNVRMKLLKITLTYSGSGGTITITWTSDRGANTGSQTFDLTSTVGDLLNLTFTINTSSIIATSSLTDLRRTKSFTNSAVGREFQFQILQSGTNPLPEIKNFKIVAVALEEE